MDELKIGVAGLGAIGRKIALALCDGLPGLALTCVVAGDRDKARAWLDANALACPIVDAASLPEHCDLVVECAPARHLDAICRPMLEAGRAVMTLSAGALLPRPDLVDLARARGGRIIVPTGALIGLDAVCAAAEGEIRSVRMITRKPPGGLAGAPHLVANGIVVEGLSEPLLVFSGSARDAAIGFPANVNVAAALSLAGVGPDATTIEIWADPTVVRNCHRIEVDADSASFSMTIENVPSENPKTGRITALSTIAALRKLRAPLRIGT